MVALGRHDGKGRLDCACRELPAETTAVGPVGLQTVDHEQLAEALGAVHEAMGGSRRVAVVVPTGWVRTHLLDFAELPRRQPEVAEVVRWRLKKLLPVPPAELRLSIVPQASVEGRRRLLVTVALERAMAELEGTFSEVGVMPGLITPGILALASIGDDEEPGARLHVQYEEGFFSLLLLDSGVPLLLRTKPLTTVQEPWPTVGRELHMALTYIRDTLDVTGSLEVMIAASAAEIDEELRSWWSGQDAVTVVPARAGLGDIDPDSLARIGPARLAAIRAVTGLGPS
jgi:hypothetical protein